jgi:hypothetical protein
MIALHAAIHDGIIALLCDALLRDGWVHPFWESPVACWYLAPLDRCACVIQHRLFERLVEDSVVQEDVWVVVPPIEVSLNRLDRLYYTFQFLIPRQDYEGGVRSGCVDSGLETAYSEGLVILLADFSAQMLVSIGHILLLFSIPYERRRTGGHLHEVIRAWRSCEEQQDHNDYKTWEEKDQGQWHRHR